MKKLLYLLPLLLLLTGCAHRTIEPDELEMIRVIGIDAADKGYRVTVCTGTPSDEGEPHIRSGEGATIDGALTALQSRSAGHIPFYSHTDWVLVGEEQARRDIAAILDYMARSSEMRIDTGILVVRGDAGELMTDSAGENRSAADCLRTIEEEAETHGEGHIFTALDAASALVERGCGLILSVELTEGDDQLEEDVKNISPAGFALVTGRAVSCFIAADETAGVVLLTSKPETFREDLEGVGVDLTGIRVKYEPIFEGEALDRLKIGLTADVSVSELTGEMRLTNNSRRSELEKAVSRRIYSQLQRAVSGSLNRGEDYMGLLKLGLLRDYERPDFGGLPIEIEVTARLRRSYDMEDPLKIG